MKYQNENIEYYSTHIGNIDEFMKKNEARVILFRRSNRYVSPIDFFSKLHVLLQCMNDF